MNKNIKSYAKIFWQLLKTDLLIYKQNVKDQIIDVLIWVIPLTLVYTYIFPQIGMTKDFGSFYVVGTMVSVAVFNIWNAATVFVADLEGDKAISYPLTLPMPSKLYFIKLAVGYACKTIVTSFLMLPLGKLLLWNKINFANISIFKFILIFLSINLFVGIFAIFAISVPKNIRTLDSILMRIIFPLWFLSGAEFSWQTLYGFSTWLAFLLFFNPFLYLMEGARAAVLGQADYLNFWICLAVIWVGGVLFGLVGIRRLKRNLDFV